MGANATTSVPVYASGEVLTAADLNITNSGIPVFADATARNNGFGGTGEKVLAEGQYAYLEDTNSTQFYDGAAWQTVGQTPGMVRVGGASFSAVAGVEFANDTFTNTYKYYFVSFNVTSSNASQAVALRVRNNSGPVTGSNYTGQAYTIRSNGTLTTGNTNSATSQTIGYSSSVATAFGLYVSNPTSATIRTNWWGQASARDSAGDIAATTIAGQYTVEEAHTGLNFFVAGTMTGNYNIYGLAES
jgi:hypothetical protein